VPRILIVDNYDSFTYNLYQMLGEVSGHEPVVVTNDADWASVDPASFDAVVLSPGPGTPKVPSDVGICRRILAETNVPVLGICLGHQLIGDVFGADVTLAPTPMHGRVSRITHNGDLLFTGIPTSFDVVRYHSLCVQNVPADLEVTARSEDGVIMALRHPDRPLWGVQFHPESILTEHGHTLLRNFVRVANLERRRSRRLNTSRTYRVEARVVGADTPAPQVFRELYGEDRSAFWLDSGDGGRCSIMGNADGVLAHTLRYRLGEGSVEITDARGTSRVPGDLFSHLNTSLAQYAVRGVDGLPCDFTLGYVGYLGYELRGDSMDMAVGAVSDYDDAHLTFAERALVIDHETGHIHGLALVGEPDDEITHASTAWLDALPARIAAAHPLPPVTAPERTMPLVEVERRMEFRHGRSEYLNLILECQEYIRQGESYELCLTNTLHSQTQVDPWETYLRLRAVSPVPYGAYLTCGEMTVLSASPERFLKVSVDGLVESRPIKGTRPRGANPVEDEALRTELYTSEKDRAENLMIVDLLRNDLNTVCEIGSVHVPHLFTIDTFPLVHQLVSTVRGQLRADRSSVDCVRSAFPGGSMTGAPKRRTLELLEKLEAGPRGVYSGALGWFSLNGAVDLSIVIRTIVTGPGGTTLGVGGAITALSDPAEEYTETLVKARGMVIALTDTPVAASTPAG